MEPLVERWKDGHLRVDQEQVYRENDTLTLTEYLEGFVMCT